MVDPKTRQAAELMESFAERTGLTEREAAHRYLWTDAFAVCNFVALRRRTGDARYAVLAGKLVERVHDVLAPHHDSEHPTAAGLRIGKPLAERGPNDLFDEELEWERDGQYFHYLTRWMYALDQLARDTNQPTLNLWARELAATAHRAFTYAVGDHKRMYWKMSIDLSRPLVSSMGQHDPLDGFVTYIQLATSANAWPFAARTPDLGDAIADFARMIEPHALATADPLGLGGLLIDAHRLQQLIEGEVRGADNRLVDALVAAAAVGLRHFERRQDLRIPASRRLGFRELGLAIGLAAAARMGRKELDPFLLLGEELVELWSDPGARASLPWREHQDINDVMLATALLPDGIIDRVPLAHTATEHRSSAVR